jgi:hypothetical protein
MSEEVQILNSVIADLENELKAKGQFNTTVYMEFY